MDFKEKINRVVKEVFSLLGEPAPLEIERKFLIKRPTEEEIATLGYVSRSEIIQTYLKSCGTSERRVRQRGSKSLGYSFTYTEKSDISKGVRIERNRDISKEEYINYLVEADTSLHQISKTRYCFVFQDRYFELDIYPFSDEYAVLEIEVNDMNEKINLPDLKIIKEVTGDEAFKNHSLAKDLRGLKINI